MDSSEQNVPSSDPTAHDTRPSKRRCLSAQPHREVGLMRSFRGDKFSGFVGSASGIYFIRSVYGAIRELGTDAPITIDTPASDVVPGEDDQLPTVLPYTSDRLWKDNEITSRPCSYISYETFVELSGSYFANWHMLFPFLHAPTVLAYFEQLPSLTESSTAQDLKLVIVRSIMSISLADQRQAGHRYKLQYPTDLVFSSYDSAVDSLQHVLTRPTSVLGLQAAIGVQLFLMSMLRLNAASRLGGLINRMAVQLGLHRCPARYTSFTAAEKELRQRVFWSLYTIDRFICQSMGLPLGINDDDVDVCFPNAEHHMDVRQESFQDDRLKLQNFVARESRLRGEIIELRNKSLHYVHKDAGQATAITARLAQWWKEVEDSTNIEGNPAESSYHSTILALLKHESIISLHRPILAASRQGAEYDAALQLCIGSAQSIILDLYEAMSANIDSRQSLTLLWPSCTWAVWISTFILFYAVNSGHLSQDVVVRLADRSMEVLQHLAQRGSAWPEASATAIRDLRSRMMRRLTVTSRNEQSDTTGDNARQSQQKLPNLVPGALDSVIYAPEALHATFDNSDYGLLGIGQDGRSYLDTMTRSNEDTQPQTWTANESRQQDIAYNNVASPSSFLPGHLVDPGNDPGYLDILDPFSGFDIPFWFEQDQHWDLFQNYE